MEEAKKLGGLIIHENIAASVDFWPISSCYNWDEGFQCVEQAMLLISTFETKLEDIKF